MSGTPRDHYEMFDDFIHGRLAHGEWTHEAHLITCWVTLQDREPAEAIDYLRASIKAHNCGTGVANTDTSGYHETLTRYYVHAVSQAAASAPEDLFADPTCDRKAPLNHWSKELLFSTQARLNWTEPDLQQL